MRFIPWVVALLLCLIHLIVLIAFTGALIFSSTFFTTQSVIAAAYWLFVLICSFLLFRAVIKPEIRRSRKLTIYSSVISLLMVAGFIFLLIDDKPPINDYTEEDIRTEPNESSIYIDILSSYSPKKPKKANNKPYGEQIESRWQSILKYRQAINALDQFHHICDLKPNIPLNLDTPPVIKYPAFRQLAETYRDYFYYKAGKGEETEAVQDIAKFHGFTRKGMADATLLINKIIFASQVSKTLDMVYDSVNNNRYSQSTLLELQKIFTPLAVTEYSLKRSFISEYIVLKNVAQKRIRPNDIFDFSALMGGGKSSNLPWFSAFSQISYHLGFKPNMTVCDLKQLLDRNIEAQDMTPPDFTSAIQHFDDYIHRPQLRNMTGWIFISIALPNYSVYSEKVTRIKIKSDLLAIALSEKTKNVQDIKDYYIKGPYRFKKEEKTMRHPGQDGQYNTEDDIILGGNHK